MTRKSLKGWRPFEAIPSADHVGAVQAVDVAYFSAGHGVPFFQLTWAPPTLQIKR